MELGIIKPVGIVEQMTGAYLDYSMSVIVSRALPDVRDGLKPVHRRVLYAMDQMGLQSNRSPRKCAGIVGEVLKEFHPHGDAAVYDTLVRLTQPWNMRYPLRLARATSAQWMTIPRPRCATRKPRCRRLRRSCWPTSTRIR